MLNGEKHFFETDLKKAFESGYSNAASSLSKMMNDQIDFNNFQFGFQRLGSSLFPGAFRINQHAGSLLITTEIFGDVTGKSYLFLSDKEFEFLTAGIPESKDPAINLKEEFTKEVDNILSASVITRLSNELKLKMYGDIPIWIGRVGEKIETIIEDDFEEQGEEIYLNAVFLSFRNHPTITPLFIWVVDTGILRSIALQSVL
jgi:chemotaxis protein CheY-P-specific phosphatase CheC